MTGDELCPVAAIVLFAVLKGDATGHFSASKTEHTNKPKILFQARICETMVQAGISTENYSGQERQQWRVT